MVRWRRHLTPGSSAGRSRPARRCRWRRSSPASSLATRALRAVHPLFARPLCHCCDARSGATMKRVLVDHFGGPEVVTVVDADVPRPGPGEVRVRVLAAGVSFTDSQLRAGTYIPGGPKPPFTPGYELVGVVE